MTAICLFVAPALAAQYKVYIYSGTGFFVDRDGHILTNLHVVSNDCKHIVVTGAVPEQQVKLIASDSEHDLALLKSDSTPPEVASLRGERRAVQAGDHVTVIGYPGKAYETGDAVTREAHIDKMTGPGGEEKWMQLSDVVNQGNSGGPVLDDAGNVVGVVMAKAEIYSYRTDDPQNGVHSKQGIAINLPVVERFLADNRVNYSMSDADSYLSSDRVSDLAHRFLVNVRCEYKTERIN
jgi:S1-C subfamily serine protease